MIMDWSIFGFAFMQKALVAGALGGAACGLAGVFVVLLRVSFFGVCIAHAAFAGSLLAVLAGLPPQVGGMALGLGSAAAVGPLSRRGALTPDTATGILFSVMMGLAMLALALLPGSRADGMGLVWGSILTVDAVDLWMLGGALAVVAAFVCALLKEVHAVCCHPEAARACGIDVDLVMQAVFLLLGLVIAAGIRTIGGLLIFSLIVTPAAAAYQLTYSIRRMFLLSAAFGVLSCWGGLLISAAVALPTGAVIVLCAVAILAASTLSRAKRAR